MKVGQQMSVTGGELRALLERTSASMESLCGDLDEPELRTQFDPEFSPIGWHLGHVAWQEECWILRRFAGEPPLNPALDEVFDAFRPDKSARGRRLPSKQGLFTYRALVRAKVLECLEALLHAPGDELMSGAALPRFVANHESQHTEIVVAMRLAAGLALDRSRQALGGEAPDAPAPAPRYVPIPAGRFMMGSADDPDRWDNEGGPHLQSVAAFRMARHAVSNGEWQQFIEQGGYADERLWSAEGWRFVRERNIDAPLYWQRDAHGEWHERTLVGVEQLTGSRPVCHVSWHEAQAFAKFAGARLPSEAEWEWAASGAGAPKRRYPWGDSSLVSCDWALANLVRRAVGQAGENASPQGVLDLTGGVWEWTSDTFAPYPGFEPQAYRGYSAPWFDGRHRVARGGSYVTRPEIARSTFRNWYLPTLRRAFTGVRLVSDAC